jgi:hypothetical protein
LNTSPLLIAFTIVTIRFPLSRICQLTCVPISMSHPDPEILARHPRASARDRELVVFGRFGHVVRRFLLTPGAKSLIFEKRTCYLIVAEGEQWGRFFANAGLLPCFAVRQATT